MSKLSQVCRKSSKKTYFRAFFLKNINNKFRINNIVHGAAQPRRRSKLPILTTLVALLILLAGNCRIVSRRKVVKIFPSRSINRFHVEASAGANADSPFEASTDATDGRRSIQKSQPIRFVQKVRFVEKAASLFSAITRKYGVRVEASRLRLRLPKFIQFRTQRLIARKVRSIRLSFNQGSHRYKHKRHKTQE